MKLLDYSRPILLLHFPLFRKNDAECDGASNWAQPAFKEKWDCLSKKASNFLLNEFNPRLVFTGHTHEQCRKTHKNNIKEFTVPSFNWRNTPNPSLIMAVFTTDQWNIEVCHLPHEYFVIGVYLCVLFLQCYTFLRRKC